MGIADLLLLYCIIATFFVGECYNTLGRKMSNSKLGKLSSLHIDAQSFAVLMNIEKTKT